MNEPIDILIKLRDDYIQRVKALDEAIEKLRELPAAQVRHPDVFSIPTPPIDMNKIPDYNPNDSGGIRLPSKPKKGGIRMD